MKHYSLRTPRRSGRRRTAVNGLAILGWLLLVAWFAGLVEPSWIVLGGY